MLCVDLALAQTPPPPPPCPPTPLPYFPFIVVAPVLPLCVYSRGLQAKGGNAAELEKQGGGKEVGQHSTPESCQRPLADPILSAMHCIHTILHGILLCPESHEPRVDHLDFIRSDRVWILCRRGHPGRRKHVCLACHGALREHMFSSAWMACRHSLVQ